jgi:tetratricopeptide (TPR) repeat protein
MVVRRRDGSTPSAGTTPVAPARRRSRSLLEDLYAANVINQPAHHRYALHDLVVAYATRLAADLPEPDRRAALDRLFEQYAATSSRAMGLTHPWEAHLLPGPPATQLLIATVADREQAQAWLNTEIDNLNGLGTVHYLRGHYRLAADCYEQALANDRRTGNRRGEQDAL